MYTNTYEQIFGVHAKAFKIQDYSTWYHNEAIHESYHM